MNAWTAFALGAGAVLVLRILFRFGRHARCCHGGLARMSGRLGDGCCGSRAKSGKPDAEDGSVG